MKLLVTGGAGYIGSVVSEAVLEAGNEVIVLDNLGQGHRQAVPSGARLILVDLADREALNQFFRQDRVDGVLHLAALTLVEESVQDPVRYFQANVTNSLNLLQAMERHGVDKLVFASSAAVYKPGGSPFREEAATGSDNPYGESKLLLEMVLPWCAPRGLKYAVLRFFNVAGATPERGEDHQPETHLIPRVLRVALGQEEKVYIYGSDYPTRDGTAVRDYIHVRDLARAHLLALASLEKNPGQTYNLGNGRGFSVKEVVDVARRVSGRPIPAQEAPRRPGDPPELVASAQKAQKLLGWKPQYPDLEAIIASAWEWMRRHPRGYN